MLEPRCRTLAVPDQRTGHWTSRPAMALLTAALFTTTLVMPVTAQNHLQSDSAAFLVSISEATIDHKNATTSADCILVLPDGRFHLERRKDVPPNPTSSLSIFESALDSTQLEHLHDILNGDGIKKLPDYTLPVFPMTVPWFETFTAKIPRDGQIRTVGYWLWRGGTAEASPNSTPDRIKAGWKDSEVALGPLVAWFHQIESLKLSPSNSESAQCAVDASSAIQ
jgi:hypothetical protein